VRWGPKKSVIAREARDARGVTFLRAVGIGDHDAR